MIHSGTKMESARISTKRVDGETVKCTHNGISLNGTGHYREEIGGSESLQSVRWQYLEEQNRVFSLHSHPGFWCLCVCKQGVREQIQTVELHPRRWGHKGHLLNESNKGSQGWENPWGRRQKLNEKGGGNKSKHSLKNAVEKKVFIGQWIRHRKGVMVIVISKIFFPIK